MTSCGYEGHDFISLMIGDFYGNPYLSAIRYRFMLGTGAILINPEITMKRILFVTGIGSIRLEL